MNKILEIGIRLTFKNQINAFQHGKKNEQAVRFLHILILWQVRSLYILQTGQGGSSLLQGDDYV